MTTTPTASRRSFIRTAGAALSGPVAVAVASAPRTATAAPSADDALARLTRLEDLDAIRTLSQALARHINAAEPARLAELFADASSAQVDPDLLRMTPFEFGGQDTIDIATDRQTAVARLHSEVETQRAIGPDCPVVQMARQQGSGVVRSTGRGVFDIVYVRHEGIWKLRQFRFRST